MAEIQLIQQFFAAIGHHFIAKKKKIKNADTQGWGDACENQIPFFFALVFPTPLILPTFVIQVIKTKYSFIDTDCYHVDQLCQM